MERGICQPRSYLSLYPPCPVVIIQLLSHIQLFVTQWTAAHQASLSFTIFQSLLKLMSIKSVMPMPSAGPEILYLYLI